ncbi:class I SAM-dependent methyltransferase [Streptomyces sp. NPDC091272]|uniref:class I SAM-dependent methyltransferase n=1 Tax=Streptomyces sp. NPDC091272 TaxID=3365981 RepID=UPI003822E318
MNELEIRRRVQELEPWVNDFVFEGVRYATASTRDYLLSHPPQERADAFFAAFPAAKRVLELGALEGADTLAMAGRSGVEILALEGRAENLRRAEFVMEVHGAGNVELRLADVESMDFAELGHFDATLCAGLLYHVQRPWQLLADIGAVSDCLYVSTHYWGGAQGLTDIEGYDVHLVREDHPEPQARGLSVDVRWLDRPSLMRALEEAGFTDVEVLQERRTDEVCNIVAACRKAGVPRS